MNTFFVQIINNTSAVLLPNELQHCLKVLRHKIGDTVRIIDGAGFIGTAKIETLTEKLVSVKIIQSETILASKHHFHLAIAPTKNIDRTEWFVEKAVELGVHEISFIQCAHSERKNLNIDRIYKICDAAVKQSLHAFKPNINQLQHFKSILNTNITTKCIAHCKSIPKTTFTALPFTNQILLLIGPEGDFSNEEVVLAEQHHFIHTSLGSTRLRTETAGVYASSIVKNKFEN